VAKIDFKKELKVLYNPPKKFVVVDVPEMQFLMVDGHGDPNTAQEYQNALEVLFAIAYKLKFNSKKVLGKDYVVPPLEGLWWADDMDSFTLFRDKSQWDWTMMIMTPDWITMEMFADAVTLVRKGNNPVALSKIRLETYDEQLAVQIMHVGPYDDEAPTLAKMHQDFIPQHGLEMNGKHHEIYLSDPRRVIPEKLKTVLRQPVETLGA
jgi:hypothetical protein